MKQTRHIETKGHSDGGKEDVVEKSDIWEGLTEKEVDDLANAIIDGYRQGDRECVLELATMCNYSGQYFMARLMEAYWGILYWGITDKVSYSSLNDSLIVAWERNRKHLVLDYNPEEAMTLQSLSELDDVYAGRFYPALCYGTYKYMMLKK